MASVPSTGVNVPAGQQIRFRANRTPAAAGTAGAQKLEPGPNVRALRPVEPGLIKDPNLRYAFARWQPSLLVAFRFIILIRFLGAMYTAIGDCDEGAHALRLHGAHETDQDAPGTVYNYWEPLHYLVNGKGFQTWEYSPLYAIRSYFYLLVHAGPAVTLRALGFPDKVSSPEEGGMQARADLFGVRAARLVLRDPFDASRLFVLCRSRLLPRLRRAHQLARRPLRPLDPDVLGRPLQRLGRVPPFVLRDVLCHARHSGKSVARRERLEAHHLRYDHVRRRGHCRVAVRRPPRCSPRARAALHARHAAEGARGLIRQDDDVARPQLRHRARVRS